MDNITELDSIILSVIPVQEIPREFSSIFNKYPELRGVIFDFLKNNYPYKKWMYNWINDSQFDYNIMNIYNGTSITDEERDYFVNCIIHDNDSMFFLHLLNTTQTCLFNDKLCDYIVLNDLYMQNSFMKLLPTILTGNDERNMILRRMFVLSLLRNSKMTDFIMFDHTYMRKGNNYFNGIPLLTEQYLFDSLPDFPNDYKLGVII